ncbi:MULTISPECIES: response regulator transcription factor [Clostridium]|jgi:two-component system response regulator YesN|uniref:Stage 0 sporulation protein A homolog n=3 Tax=Clostridium TaxID=1485 RepID=A0A170NIX8_9CLOT|nr:MULTISPECIES: response regulator [Clostridium]AGY76034.1 response regulator [Clostridium autoethanogenum DSM 10061]ALU36197.1 Two component transcriptional regulator AraC family [Clostridium autoethanogenum DSM 10061]OAA90198.1 putative response regulatory protein [Clostridium coskatii]OBR91024.1 putative response regulatory protein [Clostridium coskatii]OVY51745.1 putative response regulatory protein [Clostridium autoethanogenum]
MSIVLIVEDEILEQEFLKSIVLEELFPEDVLLTCESGVQAIKLAKQYKPNIIMMDVMIPELDGLSTIEEIRKFLPNVLITILSAHSDFSYAQKAISLRVFEYLLKPVKPNIIKQVFRKMLDSAADCNIVLDKSSEEKNPESKESQQYFIEKSIKYIKEHFREKITLQIVASTVFLNPKYFSRVFKKELGVSFSKYVINLRIQYACRLLKTTNYRAYRISSECGFSDPSYFNRVFCAEMNMTPQAYRKHALMSMEDD